MNVNYDSNENIWEATVTITFPCKQSIKKHDMNKFDLTQFEYRITNLVTLQVGKSSMCFSCRCHSKYRKSITPPIQCQFFEDLLFFLRSSIFSIYLLPVDI